MDEKDVQIKGYKIRLPLDVVSVASANPEDYTSRGRIITPLKDRFDVQIRTHYPKTIDDELVIMEQEAAPVDHRSRKVEVPRFLKEILGHLTFEARKSNEINQSSGVSVRVTINNYESLISNAENGRSDAKRMRSSRVSDLHAIAAPPAAKSKWNMSARTKKKTAVENLNRSIVKVFDQYFSLNSVKCRISTPVGGRSIGSNGVPRLPARHWGNSRFEGSDPYLWESDSASSWHRQPSLFWKVFTCIKS
jgi:magnesium chelatase subunit I